MAQLVLAASGLAWAVILVGGWLGWQLLKQNGRLLLRLDELEKRLDELEFGGHDEPPGLSIGSQAPAFELADLAGQQHSLAQYRGQPLVLIFFNPDCGFCRDLAPKLVEIQRLEVGGQKSNEEQRPLLLLLSTGDAQKNREFFAAYKLPLLLQKNGEVAQAYHAPGTPSGYLVSPEGKIASKLTMGAEAILQLATAPYKEEQNPVASSASSGNDRADRFGNRSLTGSKIKRDGLKAGTPAPDFRLPRLDGHGELALSDLRGKQVLLVFSSPECGPCSALAPRLEALHRNHTEAKIVMISKGEAKENRIKAKQHGLTFPIVLQQQWEISRRYAMFATPIAFLIDEAGIISREVAVGVEPILALLAETPQAPEPRSKANIVTTAQADVTM
jgi:peroxiredoxin